MSDQLPKIFVCRQKTFRWDKDITHLAPSYTLWVQFYSLRAAMRLRDTETNGYIRVYARWGLTKGHSSETGMIFHTVCHASGLSQIKWCLSMKLLWRLPEKFCTSWTTFVFCYISQSQLFSDYSFPLVFNLNNFVSDPFNEELSRLRFQIVLIFIYA